jgi:hypothetical protein
MLPFPVGALPYFVILRGYVFIKMFFIDGKLGLLASLSKSGIRGIWCNALLGRRGLKDL